jgi:AcrR family transcriptional regulator
MHIGVSLSAVKTVRQTSTYRSPLREEQKQATRQRILDAASCLMTDRGLVELSFAALASEAGVKERTVYRHFASKGALLDALWASVNARMGVMSLPTPEAEMIASLPRVFAGFDENEQLVRASLASPQGREFRLRPNKERQAAFRAATAGATQCLPKREAEWIVATVQLLYSASAWQSMKDYWGFSGEEAGKACALAIDVLLEAARKRSRITRAKPRKAKG